MANKINTSPRFLRKTVILAKLESSYAEVSTFTPATDALLISNVSMAYTSNNKERDVIRAYMGASEELVGDDQMQFTFDIEMSPSGTVAMAPAWGKLLRACAMSETVVATKSVYYKFISTGFESLAIKYFIDGVSYTVRGARGTYELIMGIGDIPKIKFTFTAPYIQSAPGAEAIPGGLSYTAWKPPLMVTNYNTGNIDIGGSYVPGTDTYTPGDAYASRGFSFKAGNNVVYQPMLGTDRVLITDRKPQGQTTLDLSAADEVQFRSDVRSNVLRSMSFDHGTTAGARLRVHAPKAQFFNPSIVDVDGVAMTQFDVRYVPTTGDDELYIVCR